MILAAPVVVGLAGGGYEMFFDVTNETPFGDFVSFTFGSDTSSWGSSEASGSLVVGSGGVVFLVNISAIFANAFRVVSPYSSDIIVAEGGVCNDTTISDAAYFK